MRNRWLTSRAIKLHVMAVFVIGVCLAAGWWQLQRALGGNGQSWAYTVEWPFFAAYAGWTWWKLLHEEPEFAKEKAALDALSAGGTKPSANGTSPVDDVEEEEREAYNEYLRALHADEGRKRE